MKKIVFWFHMVLVVSCGTFVGCGEKKILNKKDAPAKKDLVALESKKLLLDANPPFDGITRDRLLMLEDMRLVLDEIMAATVSMDDKNLRGQGDQQKIPELDEMASETESTCVAPASLEVDNETIVRLGRHWQESHQIKKSEWRYEMQQEQTEDIERLWTKVEPTGEPKIVPCNSSDIDVAISSRDLRGLKLRASIDASRAYETRGYNEKTTLQRYQQRTVSGVRDVKWVDLVAIDKNTFAQELLIELNLATETTRLGKSGKMQESRFRLYTSEPLKVQIFADATADKWYIKTITGHAFLEHSSGIVYDIEMKGLGFGRDEPCNGTIGAVSGKILNPAHDKVLEQWLIDFSLARKYMVFGDGKSLQIEEAGCILDAWGRQNQKQEI